VRRIAERNSLRKRKTLLDSSCQFAGEKHWQKLVANMSKVEMKAGARNI